MCNALQCALPVPCLYLNAIELTMNSLLELINQFWFSRFASALPQLPVLPSSFSGLNDSFYTGNHPPGDTQTTTTTSVYRWCFVGDIKMKRQCQEAEQCHSAKQFNENDGCSQPHVSTTWNEVNTLQDIKSGSFLVCLTFFLLNCCYLYRFFLWENIPVFLFLKMNPCIISKNLYEISKFSKLVDCLFHGRF